MNIDFPAVIKRIEVTESGTLALFDISPPDISLLTDLVDQEVKVTIVAPDFDLAAPPATDEKLPFEPDDAPPPKPRRKSKPKETTPSA